MTKKTLYCLCLTWRQTAIKARSHNYSIDVVIVFMVESRGQGSSRLNFLIWETHNSGQKYVKITRTVTMTVTFVSITDMDVLVAISKLVVILKLVVVSILVVT